MWIMWIIKQVIQLFVCVVNKSHEDLNQLEHIFIVYLNQYCVLSVPLYILLNHSGYFRCTLHFLLT